MKKIIALLLALVMLFCLAACGGESEPAADQNDEKESVTEKPSNYDSEGNLISIDQTNPLIEVETRSYRDIYEEDGMAHENSYRIPKLNVNLYGANTLSDKIYSQVKNEFGSHFLMLEDLSGESVRKGEPYITVDYSYVCELDVVMTVIKATKNYISGETVDQYLVYYYDALTDEELSFDEFAAFCGVSGDALHAACEEQLAQTHPDFVKDYSISYLVKTGEELYDIFVTLGNGNMITFTAAVESLEFDMSMFEG